jgi:hypothetical protein
LVFRTDFASVGMLSDSELRRRMDMAEGCLPIWLDALSVERGMPNAVVEA